MTEPDSRFNPGVVVTPAERKQQRAVLDASLSGGLAGYVERVRAQHGVLISGDTVMGCVCRDVICSHHLLLAWCDELTASYEAKVQDLAAETSRASALAAQLRDARAEVERLCQQIAAMDDDADMALTEKAEAVEAESQAGDRIAAELAAERAKVQRLQAAIDAANVQLNLAFSDGWRIDHVRAALTGGDR